MRDDVRVIENRVIVMLLPKAPFIDWINARDAAAPAIALEWARNEANVFLVQGDRAEAPGRPYFSRHVDVVQSWLEQSWSDLFEKLLSDWGIRPADWRAVKSRDTFDQWFEVRSHDTVIDCASEPLRYAG